ncbi:unnamed protein product [Gongylonema pulchrum]|uniref:COesterase domain-containing protein n=1 Tax=Gongylonema pulchrum TaxID=637853 RepID=A0A183DE16_9BILA|nr:unnamed protein product [Gongylonema pulchrum]
MIWSFPSAACMERRASAGEALLNASDYQHLGSSYAMSELVTLHRNSVTNARLRTSIPNNLTIEEEGEKYLDHCGSLKRNTVDCLRGTEGREFYPPALFRRFAGSPYAKQNVAQQRRRSWTPTNQNLFISSQQQACFVLFVFGI